MIGQGDGGGRRSKHANWRNADPAPRRTNLIVGDDLRFSSREPNKERQKKEDETNTKSNEHILKDNIHSKS